MEQGGGGGLVVAKGVTGGGEEEQKGRAGSEWWAGGGAAGGREAPNDAIEAKATRTTGIPPAPRSEVPRVLDGGCFPSHTIDTAWLLVFPRSATQAAARGCRPKDPAPSRRRGRNFVKWWSSCRRLRRRVGSRAAPARSCGYGGCGGDGGGGGGGGGGVGSGGDGRGGGGETTSSAGGLAGRTAAAGGSPAASPPLRQRHWRRQLDRQPHRLDALTRDRPDRHQVRIERTHAGGGDPPYPKRPET